MTLAERTVKTQRENLKKVHNARFEYNGYEYRLSYHGGVAEFISIDGRKKGTEQFRYIDGFVGYKLFNRDQAIAYAKNLIMSRA